MTIRCQDTWSRRVWLYFNFAWTKITYCIFLFAVNSCLWVSGRPLTGYSLLHMFYFIKATTQQPLCKTCKATCLLIAQGLPFSASPVGRHIFARPVQQQLPHTVAFSGQRNFRYTNGLAISRHLPRKALLTVLQRPCTAWLVTAIRVLLSTSYVCF